MDHTADIERRIADAIHALSPKQKQLARLILGKKYLVSFASASQIGQQVGASAATVVRFAQSLGYAGFSELQAAIREELPTYLTAVRRIEKQLATYPPPGNIPQQVFHTDISNIERTADSLSMSQLDGALSEIIQARHILVVGCGLSAAPALFLGHSLKVIGFETQIATDGGLSMALDTAQLGPGTLLIAIDLWRYVRSTLEAVHSAKRYGAQVIVVTDSSVSPMAQVADYVFEVATDGTAHSLSPTAAISLLNVLIAALSYRVPEQVMESLRRVDAAYRNNHLLTVE